MSTFAPSGDRYSADALSRHEIALKVKSALRYPGNLPLRLGGVETIVYGRGIIHGNKQLFQRRPKCSRFAWIPQGTFYFSAIHGGLNASGITIAGAGPWHSTLYRVTPVERATATGPPRRSLFRMRSNRHEWR